MWPAHRAAGKQARTVQKTDGETSISTGGTAESTDLRDEEHSSDVRSVAGGKMALLHTGLKREDLMVKAIKRFSELLSQC